MRLSDCKNSAHPIWGFGRLCTLLIALLVILYTSATSFDSNEIYTLIMVMISGASVEGLVRHLENRPITQRGGLHALLLLW